MTFKEVYEEQRAVSDRWKTMYYEKKSEADQLTNNWNELEEWLKDLPNNEYVGYLKSDILAKVKEIKEKNNVQNNIKNEV